MLLQTLAIYALISGALFYLASRALITKWAWSRYPPWFAKFADCSACMGFWFGLGLGMNPESKAIVFDGVPFWLNAFYVGLISIVTTPIVTGIMQRSLDATGYAVTDDE